MQDDRKSRASGLAPCHPPCHPPACGVAPPQTCLSIPVPHPQLKVITSKA